MISVSEIQDQAEWDGALRTLPSAHVLQSWAWTDTKAQTGWRAQRLLWTADGRPAAAAAFLSRRLSARLPIAVGYVPKGPALDWDDAALVEQVIRRIQEEAWRQHTIFLKIDPDVRSDRPTGQAVRSSLARRGWRASDEQIQFRNTMLTDLTPDEETLLASMKPKWRYNIRLAERRGVVVRDGTAADLPAFYRMYVETGGRDGFLVRPYSYYESIWSPFLVGGLAQLLLAELDGGFVAGLMLFRFGETAWYFYGASTANGRDAMPNHALQWAALRWSKAAGCTRYDWWGAPDRLEESDPMWGVYRFKAGFGGEFVPWIGAWDFPVNRPLYWFYTAAMPRLLDLARRRHRTALPAT
jgi:lipid II:glycine glycyltransferase (peptidoglycan interpeptide bridge formation enzyme)